METTTMEVVLEAASSSEGLSQSVAIMAVGLWILWTIVCLILYHKVFTVYYFNLGSGLFKEIGLAAFAALVIAGLSVKVWFAAVAIIMIFGILNWKKASEKKHLIYAVILSIVTAVVGLNMA